MQYLGGGCYLRLQDDSVSTWTKFSYLLKCWNIPTTVHAVKTHKSIIKPFNDSEIQIPTPVSMDRFWICSTLKCIHDHTIYQGWQNVSNWRSIQHTKVDIVRWNKQLVTIHLSHQCPVLSALSNDRTFVFQGASKSLQSFVKALAWGSGEASGWRVMSVHGAMVVHA